MGVQMGNQVAKKFKVHFYGIKNRLYCLRHQHKIFKETGLLVAQQVIRLAHVSSTNQHAVAGNKLICHEPQSTDLKFRDRISVRVSIFVRVTCKAEWAIVASH
jgi:hypothetical protein